MAPEQVAGDPVDGRADVYALGCVLYEMLTGARAFDGATGVVVMGKQLRETPLPPRVRAPTRPIPASVEAVVVRAMAKDPDARYPSATAMRCALEHALAAPVRRRARVRNAVSALLTGAAMLAAAGGSAVWARTHVAAIDAAMPAPAFPPATMVAIAPALPPQPAPPAAAPPATPLLVETPLSEGRTSTHESHTKRSTRK